MARVSRVIEQTLCDCCGAIITPPLEPARVPLNKFISTWDGPAILECCMECYRASELDRPVHAEPRAWLVERDRRLEG